MRSRFVTAILIGILFLFQRPAVRAAAQDTEGSICGWVEAQGATPGMGGNFGDPMTVWGTDQVITIRPFDVANFQQWGVITLPAYVRIFDPVWEDDGRMITGFSNAEVVTACESEPPPPAPVLSTSAAPASSSTVPQVNDGPLPGDGYEPGLGWWEQLMQVLVPAVNASQRSFTGPECQSEYFIQYTEEGVENCTWYVAGRRPDVCQWIVQGQGNAYQWTEHARNNGGPLGITVNDTPAAAGEIVVWAPDCAYATGYGHVALVDSVDPSHNSFRVLESNWQRSNPDIQVEDCMSFISLPDIGEIPPTGTNTAPDPLPVPTPTGQPFDFFQRLLEFFGFK